MMGVLVATNVMTSTPARRLCRGPAAPKTRELLVAIIYTIAALLVCDNAIGPPAQTLAGNLERKGESLSTYDYNPHARVTAAGRVPAKQGVDVALSSTNRYDQQASRARTAVWFVAPKATSVYRVEGPGNARLSISPEGSVGIKGDNTLFVNLGDEART